MTPTTKMYTIRNSAFMHAIHEAGGNPYFVGGCVRDNALGLDPKDFDIVVCGLTKEKLEEVIKQYYGEDIEMVGESFGSYKCGDMDITLARTDRQNGPKHTDVEVRTSPDITIDQDLFRRDFTINSMAISMFPHLRLIDPYKGMRDLKWRVIRAVNPEAFADDPLRVLRALQFRARFRFDISSMTWLQMVQYKFHLHNRLPGERILEEIKKVWDKGDPELFIEDAVEFLSPSYGSVFFRVFEPKVPVLFEDFLLHLYGWNEKFDLEIGSYIKIDNDTAFACTLLSRAVSWFNRSRSMLIDFDYELFIKIATKTPKLFRSAFMPKEYVDLYENAQHAAVPTTLAELKEIKGIDGEYAKGCVSNPIEIGDFLKEIIISGLKEIE